MHKTRVCRSVSETGRDKNTEGGVGSHLLMGEGGGVREEGRTIYVRMSKGKDNRYIIRRGAS